MADYWLFAFEIYQAGVTAINCDRIKSLTLRGLGLSGHCYMCHPGINLIVLLTVRDVIYAG